MSKIGNYVLGEKEENADARYRNDYGYEPHMVLWYTYLRRKAREGLAKSHAVRAAYTWNTGHNRPQHS